MKKLLSIDQALYSIKMKIPEDDRMDMRNINEFLKTRMHLWVDCNLPEKYFEHMIAPVTIKGGVGILPEGLDCVIMIVGSDNPEFCDKPRWREEYVGYIEKAHNDCTYTVFAECDQCTEPECSHPIIMAAEKARDMIAPGSAHMITRHYYGYGKNKKGEVTGPYDQNYCLMKPSTAPLFGADHVNGCIGWGLRSLIGDKYTYKLHNEKIKTNFKEGKVWISYQGKPYDKNGAIMMPSDSEFYKLLERAMLMEIYEYLYLSYKTPKYKGAFGTMTQLYDKAENELNINPLDLNELIAVLEDTKKSWGRCGDEIGNRTSAKEDWVRLFDDKLYNY